MKRVMEPDRLAPIRPALRPLVASWIKRAGDRLSTYETATLMGVSRQAVEQAEKRALAKIRRVLEMELAE